MFIIIWRGLGILVIAIVMASLVLTEYVVNTLSHDVSYYHAHGWPKLMSFWLASGLIYLMGRLRKGHGDALFFLPMGFWTAAMLFLGICFAFVAEPLDRGETMNVSAAEPRKSQKAVEPLPEKFAWSGTEKELAEFKAEHTPAPTAPPPPPKPARSFPPGTLTLQAIFYSPKASSAVINAKTVIPGDKVGGYTVTAIDEQAVSLSASGTNRVLKLADVKAQ